MVYFFTGLCSFFGSLVAINIYMFIVKIKRTKEIRKKQQEIIDYIKTEITWQEMTSRLSKDWEEDRF